MMTYKVKFYESSLDVVKTGVCTPFEVFQTGAWMNAKKAALEFTEDDHNGSAVVVNQETGRYLYFKHGQQVEI